MTIKIENMAIGESDVPTDKTESIGTAVMRNTDNSIGLSSTLHRNDELLTKVINFK
jgi:hypothetical protein